MFSCIFLARGKFILLWFIMCEGSLATAFYWGEKVFLKGAMPLPNLTFSDLPGVECRNMQSSVDISDVRAVEADENGRSRHVHRCVVNPLLTLERPWI